MSLDPESDSEPLNRVVICGRGELSLSKVPVPDLEKGSALVKIKSCGIGVSDLRAFYSKISPGIYPKLAGEVVRVDADAKNPPELGTRVYVSSAYSCGKCSSCQHGYTNICENRRNLLPENVALYDYLLLDREALERETLTELGKGISFAEATFAGPVADCLNSIRSVDFAKEDFVVVFGAGLMGLLHLIALKALGAREVVLVDVDTLRLEKAMMLGASGTINPTYSDPTARIKEMSGSGGADVVIVATGNPVAMETSTRMIRRHGRVNFFGGIALEKGETAFRLDPYRLHYEEQKILGTYGSTAEDRDRAAELLASGSLSGIATLLSHKFNFEDIPKVAEVTKDPSAFRVLVEL